MTEENNNIDVEDYVFKKSTIIKVGNDKPAALKERHYVDKAAFYEALVERDFLVKKAKEAELPKPQASDFIGTCVMDICTNLAKKHQFSGYHFKDEMIADAIYHCIRYIDSFNIEKSDNPFSYFTQAAYYQFIKRIQQEKEQLYIRCKATMGSAIFNETSEDDGVADNAKHIHDNMDMDTVFMDAFIDEYEMKYEAKKEKAKLAKQEKDKEKREARAELKYGMDLIIEGD